MAKCRCYNSDWKWCSNDDGDVVDANGAYRGQCQCRKCHGSDYDNSGSYE